MSRVQSYGRRNQPTRPPASPPPSPQQAAAAVLQGGGSGEAATGSSPPSAGPLAGLWRGERDEAGRGPLKHKPTALFRSTLNSKKQNAQAARQCVWGGLSGIGGCLCGCGGRRLGVHHGMKSVRLSPDHGGDPHFYRFTRVISAV